MKMKATKKIVGAACALVAAVALSAGSTFAWFSSNGAVTADGMKVSVNTNNAYLVIADSTGNLKDGATSLDLTHVGQSIKTGTGTDESNPAVYEDILILPSTYKTATKGDDGSITYVDNTKEGANKGTNSIVDATTWYTAQGKDFEDGSIKVDDEGNPVTTALSSTNFGKYVIVSDIVVSVSKGSVGVENVKAEIDVTVTDEAKTCPLKIVILYQEVEGGAVGETPVYGSLGDWKMVEFGATAGLPDGIVLGDINNSNGYIAVKAMVYMDGSDTNVTTANQANLTGCTIDFTFTDPGQASGD